MNKLIRILVKTLLLVFLLFNVIIAFHAYKFTHFYENGTAGIKRPEEKTGWDKTREILFGINAEKQKNNAPDSGCQVVQLKTSNGLKLECWYNTVTNSRGTVCLFHGHGGKKSGTNDEAGAFRSMGFNTLQVDFRAHGNSDGNTSTIGYYESEDVKLAYDYIKGKGEKNIILWGISMGAAAVSKTIHDYPDVQPSRLILEMPFATIVQAAEGRLRLMHLPGEPLARFLIFWGGMEHAFWAFGMKPVEFVRDIKCPVLLQWGAHDPRVTRSETDAIYQNLPGVKKLVVYDSSGHESLCKKENLKWKTTVTEFLK